MTARDDVFDSLVEYLNRHMIKLAECLTSLQKLEADLEKWKDEGKPRKFFSGFGFGEECEKKINKLTSDAKKYIHGGAIMVKAVPVLKSHFKPQDEYQGYAMELIAAQAENLDV